MIRLLLLFLWPNILLAQQPITDKIGAAIYQQGQLNTTVKVLIGPDAIPAPLKLFACTNCHGESGVGKQEAGITAPDIRWSQLTKPYQFTSIDGRQRGPYNRALLARAITNGIDASGNQLNHHMPRYQLVDPALNKLLDYLEQLEHLNNAGIADDYINISILLPDINSAEGQALSAILKPLIKAYFDQINRQGGIYNRLLQAHYSHQQVTPEDIFAVLDLRFQTSNLSSPTILTIAAYGEESSNNQHHYTLYPTPEKTKQILIDAIYHHLALAPDQIIDLEAHTNDNCSIINNKASAFFISSPNNSQCIQQWLTTWRQHPSPPSLLLANPSAQDYLFKQHPSPVYTILPMSLQDISLRGQRNYQQLTRDYSLSQQQIIFQFMTLASAETMISALQQTGRNLNHATFIKTLHNFYEFDSGFSSPITFGVNRRLGIQSGRVKQLKVINDQIKWGLPEQK